jgi:hypothetical protein
MKTALGLLVVLVGSCAKSEPSATEGAASASPATVAVPAAAVAPGSPAVAPVEASARATAPATVAGSVKYAVFGVKSDDVLNVRATPDAKSKKVYSYGPSVTAITSTGRQLVSGGVPWVEVAFEGGTGWVNRSFVREVKPGGGCNDPELTALIRTVMRAVASSDGAALQEIVSPVQGLLVRKSPTAPSVRIPANEAAGVFTSAASKSWGSQVGPFKSVILPSLREDIAGKGAKEVCGKLLMGSGSGLDWPAELAGFTLVSFHRPEQAAQPWHTTVAGLEYVDGKPYLAALVQYDDGALGAAAATPGSDEAMPEGMRLRHQLAAEHPENAGR